MPGATAASFHGTLQCQRSPYARRATTSIRPLLCADAARVFDACALQLGARATAISNGWAGESTMLSQHGDFVQASVALCITVPQELHGVESLMSCHNHHPFQERVTLVGSNSSEGAVTLEKVPDRIVVRAKRDCSTHVDPQAATSGSVIECGTGFEVGAAAMRHFCPRPIT